MNSSIALRTNVSRGVGYCDMKLDMRKAYDKVKRVFSEEYDAQARLR
jgi:hypothetical protein